MSAYYNEIDPYAAQWLRNLIAAGHIAPGDVDERSIEDVRPDDLRGYTQCHFFAGIGVWSYALRRAGWPDDRSVWTGSCPCQPFSGAGKGLGFADERHLWPAWFHLIRECRPAVVFGEQVASSAVEPWIDLVQADVESLGHAFGCVPFPSAGVNAPHIRDRTYWLAYADGRYARAERQQRSGEYGQQPEDGGALGGLGHAERIGAGGYAGAGAGPQGGIELRSVGDHARSSGAARGLADTSGERRIRRQGLPSGGVNDGSHAGRIEDHDGPVGGDEACIPRIELSGPADSFWRTSDWLLCRDGKWRPVEPGTFPLVDGAPARVGRLRAYGNAINAEAARAFIETCIELI
ncbi:DNA cytosine methyltransferase [Burkholderia gladioli]|uniref:DNA cytosine methyltransferase n=1 Tax=Burkholderia gladioli TaxID=28095 RepID=UPI001364CFAB|nr:DNA cytosine methyltransferase [Burkholderia gladioli]WAG21344.1 DNA cytosine methyltransferase [Burkholderia gladioli]